ncbi:hypothetical protein ACFYNO_24450 [Kitasatospora sp. NPDC006697]|uniref:hypothetical protein n=1 Tax=Kitasatospora sp. NPDC006697 TaxID=3364020 RepID=UPI0036773CCA
MRDSLQVVRKNKRLLVLPVLGTLGMAGPLTASVAAAAIGGVQGSERVAVSVVIGVLITALGAFFGGAMIFAADDALSGRPVRIGAAYARAARSWLALLTWTLFSVLVNLLIQAIRWVLGSLVGELLSSLLGGVLGAIWTVGGYLMLPAMLLDGHGLRAAGEASVRSFTQYAGSVTRTRWLFAVPALLTLLPALVLVILAGESGSAGFSVAGFAAAVTVLAFATTLGVTASGVFRVRLYRMASAAPRGTDAAMAAV